MIPVILLGALLLFSACTSSPSEPAPVEKTPNIVFIMADDLGYGHLGSYGQTRIQTPRLDRMAEEGTRFTQFYSGDNVCAPSHGGYLLDRENCFLANGPLRGFKGNFYEGGIRVPLIVRWPGHLAAKATDDFKWTFWDVLPTLASLGGAEAPGGIDGISVSSRILGEAQQEPDRFLYWKAIPGLLGGDVQPRSVALRYGKWKAIQPRADRPLELYDLEADIGERNNVADQQSEIMVKIRNFLATARTTPLTYPPQEPNWGYPRLETGYVR